MFHDMGASSSQYAANSERNAQHNAAYTAQRIENECVAGEALALRDCIAEAVDAGAEYQQGERDLEAQRGMSKWAFWLLVVAGGQLAATIIALIYLKATLDATWQAVKDTGDATDAMRDANEIARRSSELQLRPYLTMVDDGTEMVRRSDWDKPEGSDSPIAYAIRVATKNCGATPARNVRKRLGVLLCPSNVDPDEVGYAEIPVPSVDIAPQDCSKTWLTYFFDTEREKQFLNGELTIHVIANIQYDGIDDDGEGHLLQFRLLCDKRSFNDKVMAASARQFIST
jgi:hypothetical protein